MDFIAHGLWTNIVFYKKYPQEKRQRYLAVFFGMMPDLVFAPAFIYMLMFVRGRFNEAVFSSNLWMFKFASVGYQYTHSIVIFIAVMILVVIIRKGKMYWPMWGWALHIGIDIFTHKDFYETPFLFPLSNYKIGVVAWGHPLFMLINYSALAVCYLVWFLVLRKKKYE